MGTIIFTRIVSKMLSTLSYYLEGITTTEWILLACVLFLLSFYYYATSHHGVWERVGIPGPRPWPVIDHMLEVRKAGGFDAVVDKWFKQYGDTFGAYGLFPHVATMFTKDINLIKQVLVKDFDNFTQRYRAREFTTSSKDGLTAVNDAKWRRQRHVTTPMFTGGKMKVMLDHVNASAQTLTELAKKYQATGRLVPVKEFVNKFSTEVIARIGFGVTTHSATEEESQFAYYSRNLIRFNAPFQNTINFICLLFPPFYKILTFLYPNANFINLEADSYFTNIVTSAMNQRKEAKASKDGNPRKARDMLDFMMEVEVEKNDPSLTDMNAKTLSHDEILGNSTILILAGVETVSTAFQSILYCLAVHQDVQDKLVAEIEEIVPRGKAVEYEHLAQLKYTEQVINECLRLYPLLTNLLRKTNETKTYDGVTVPKGSVVVVPIAKIMKDPRYWPDPEKFDPDRFAPEKKSDRDPMTFMPFGYGPRICLGQRLALLELKVILVNLLREVRFELSNRTEPKKGESYKIEVLQGLVIRQKVPVQLEVSARH